MDPDVVLAHLRELMLHELHTEDVDRAQLLFETLDNWLSNGGFLPKGWDKQVHFDSHGHTYGRAGYLRAAKDPQYWEVLPPGSHWMPLPSLVGGIDQVDDNWKFRRRPGFPLTAKELYG